MVSKLLKTNLLFGLLLLASSAFAQPVQVSVALAPPYPIHLDDYAQMKGQIIVSLVNTSQTFLQLRLVPSVQGQNGISATLKPGYRPASPLSLGPLETKVLTGAQLQSLNMGISLENMDVKGLNIHQIIRTETLPEGMYDLCIRAFDFSSATQLSKDGQGCAMFNITWYDPPVVVNPADKSNVQPLQPQFLNVSWTPSGIGGVTRYRLRMMDMTANGLANPNDAFDMGFPPFFEKEYLITLAYPLSSAEPPLTAGHKYAVRVQAYDPQGKLKFKNDGRSAVTTFIYGGGIVPGGPGGTITGAGGGGGIDIPFDDLSDVPNDPIFNLPDPEDPNTCKASFEIPMPSNATTYTPKNGDTVLVGKFRMIITSLAGTSGEGTIYTSFLKTKVKVKFENLQLNGQKQAFGNTKAWAIIDKPELVDQSMASDPNGSLSNVKIKELNEYVNQSDKKVSEFDGQGGQPTGVPFALDNAKAQNLIFLGLIFTATKAQANIVFGMPVPEALANDWFQLGDKGVGIRPNGFGQEEGKLFLNADKSFAISDYTNFLLYGGSDKTYLEFECGGISKLQLNGGIEFARTKALPVNAQNKVVAAPAKLVAKFNTTIVHPTNWTATATLSHPKFSVPQAEGILFSAEDLMIDQSSTSNVPGMKFPANHPKKNKVDWRGVYLGTVSVSMPEWMKDTKKNAPVSVASLKDLLLDKTGLWTDIQAIGVMPKLDDGELAGWAFSVDTIRLKIESSTLVGGGVGGVIRLPVCEAGIRYSATIAQGNPEADFSFSIKTNEEIEIDAFIAKAVFGPNSSITVDNKDGKYKPIADVNGDITVGWSEADEDAQTDNAVSSFGLPTLHFSKLFIRNNDQGKPRVEEFAIEWDNQQNDQSKLAGFPLQLTGLDVDCNGETLKLSLGLGLTLTKGEAGKNGLKGNTDFTIHGVFNEAKKCYLYQKTTIDAVAIDVKLSVAHITGSVTMYKKDDTFGNGFKGEIHAIIEGIGIDVKATLQVGNKTENNVNFDYFYFDGLFKYDQGFKVPGAPMASIYGFGGGVWYNMERTKGLKAFAFSDYGTEPGNLDSPGSTASGVHFEPQIDKIGFEAKVIFGLSGGSDAGGRTFNGDVTFSMYLSKVNKFAVDSIVLDGHGYMLQSMNSRNDAKIEGGVHMQMVFGNNPSFTLLASLTVDLGSVLSGSATLNMHFSGSSWFVHLGKWSEKEIGGMEPWSDSKDNTRCRLSVDLKVLKAAVGCYFMIGSDIPGLPPLPKNIRDVMEDQEHKAVADDRNEFSGFNEMHPGFGFGAALFTHLDISVLIVYADIKLTLGFDASLQQLNPEMTCSGHSIGINNWYAKGQAYAQLNMELGLQLNLWFWKSDKWKLFDINATAVLQGSFPNPNYFAGMLIVKGEALNGLIKVNRSFQFETGEKPCLVDSPFGNYPIVAELSPVKGETLAAHHDIQIAFNFPKGYFEVANEYEPEIPAKFYRYKIEKFEISGDKKLALRQIEYNDDYRARYQCNEAYGLWPENASLKLSMVLNGYEKGKADPIAKSGEQYNYSFKTGEWPDKISFGMIAESSPQPNKRYFINDGKPGFLKYKPGKGQGYLFVAANDDQEKYDVSKTKFYTVFTELTTGKRTIGSFTANASGSKVDFGIPSGLSKAQIYSFEIIKELTTWPKPVSEQDDPNNPQVGGGWGSGDSEGNSESGQYTDGEWKELYGGGVYRFNRKILGDTTVKKIRIALCRIYFRTSIYNSMEAKVATYSVKGTGYLPVVAYQRFIKAKPKGQSFEYSVEEDKAITTDNAILFMSGGEPFDEYDTYGYTLDPSGFAIKVDPHVKFDQGSGQKFPTEYYDQYNQQNSASDVEIKSYFIGRDYFGSGWDYISDVHTPALEDLGSYVPWAPYIEFWRNSKYGNANAYKPAGLQVALPGKVLSKAEIDAAKAQAPQYSGGNIGHLAIDMSSPGNPHLLPGLGLAAGDPSKYCVPVVDVSGFVVNRDYCFYMRDGWGYYNDHYGQESQQNWLRYAYDYMQDYLKPRSEAKQSIKMNGHLLNYTWKKY